MLIRELRWRHLQRPVFAFLHLGGDLVRLVEVAFADLEDLDCGGQTAEFEHPGVVEGLV